MDAFYASVEQRENPGLRGKAVIVGGPPTRRGVVCAASYEARKFGVRSAMPSVTAGRLCPDGIFIPPRMDLYKAESREIMNIVRSFGATVEQVSIDEAYLEFTALFQSLDAIHDQLLERAVPLGREMKQRVFAERGLTASIGIAGNKFLAKLGSDYQKPDGLTLIPEATKVDFLRPLPVRRIHGVGPATEKTLNTGGIFTIGDLQDYAGDLRVLAGSWSRQLRAFAFGRDERPLDLGDEVKSISSEETFEQDTASRTVLRQCLWSQAKEVGAKLQRRGLAAFTIQVKVRYSDFHTLTRQITLEDPISEPRTLYRMACFLLARDKLVKRPLRLLGLGASGFAEGRLVQLRLF